MTTLNIEATSCDLSGLRGRACYPSQGLSHDLLLEPLSKHIRLEQSLGVTQRCSKYYPLRLDLGTRPLSHLQAADSFSLSNPIRTLHGQDA